MCGLNHLALSEQGSQLRPRQSKRRVTRHVHRLISVGPTACAAHRGDSVSAGCRSVGRTCGMTRYIPRAGRPQPHGLCGFAWDRAELSVGGFRQRGVRANIIRAPPPDASDRVQRPGMVWTITYAQLQLTSRPWEGASWR